MAKRAMPSHLFDRASFDRITQSQTGEEVAMKATYYPAIMAGNPARPPDWRRTRAMALIGERKYLSQKRDDAWTCRAGRFFREMCRCLTEKTYRRLAMRDPDIFLALSVAQDGGLRQTEIEGRIFAGQSDLAISRIMGIPASAVAAYEGLFCAVRDRLHASSYMAWAAGARIGNPPAARTLFLLSALRHGPTVVEPWIDYFEHAGEQHDLATREGRRRASIELAVHVHQIDPTTEAAQRSFLRNGDLVARLNLEENGRSVSIAGAFSQQTAKILGEIPWAVPPARDFAERTASIQGNRRRVREAAKAG